MTIKKTSRRDKSHSITRVNIDVNQVRDVGHRQSHSKIWRYERVGQSRFRLRKRQLALYSISL